MKVHCGTSGYSYAAWKGHFFPDDLPSSEMLSFYAQRFSTVEINNTFYRTPSSAVVAKWATQVPQGFTFVIKAPRRITHQKQLKDASEEVSRLLEAMAPLGEKLGPFLFQLPPFMKKDAPKLRDFLVLLPRKCRVAFEFRHPSWFDDEVMEALRASGAALCAAETDEAEARLVPTGDWGYLRLRRTEYDSAGLEAWARRIRDLPWREVYAFFKHEDEAKGPKFAAMFQSIVAGSLSPNKRLHG